MAVADFAVKGLARQNYFCYSSIYAHPQRWARHKNSEDASGSHAWSEAFSIPAPLGAVFSRGLVASGAGRRPVVTNG